MTNSKQLFAKTPVKHAKYQAETIGSADIPAAMALIHNLTDRLYQIVSGKLRSVSKAVVPGNQLTQLEIAIHSRDSISRLISMSAMSDSSFVMFSDTPLAEALAAGDEAEIERLERAMYSEVAEDQKDLYRNTSSTMLSTLTLALGRLLREDVKGTTAEIEIRNGVEFVSVQWAEFVVAAMKRLAATGYRPKRVGDLQNGETEYFGRKYGLLAAAQHKTVLSFGPDGEIIGIESSVDEAFKRGDWVEEKK